MYSVDFGDGLSIEWNGSATFNVFVDGVNTDCFTHYSATPDNWLTIAKQWFTTE